MEVVSVPLTLKNLELGFVTRVVRACLPENSFRQKSPYDRRGRVGLFRHSWQCEPFPH